MVSGLCTLAVYLKIRTQGQWMDVPNVDSTPLWSPHIKCKHSQGVMKGPASEGECSIGWFYVFIPRFTIYENKGWSMLEELLVDGIDLIKKKSKNIKNTLMLLS